MEDQKMQVLVDAKMQATGFDNDIDNFVGQVDRAVIESEEAYAKANDFSLVMRKTKKEVEDARKDLVKVPNYLTKEINGYMRPVREKLESAQKKLSSKMLAYRQEIEKARREREAEERKRLEEQALEDAAKAKTEEEQEAILTVASEVKIEQPTFAPTGEMGGTSHIRTTWKGEVANIKEALKAIIAGDLSTDIISFSASALNKIAKESSKEGVFNGIKHIKEESIVGRG